MPQFSVYIVTGGLSSRFGSDKARVLRDGRPQLVWLAEQLRPVGSSITAVARDAGEYADLGVRTIADRVPGLGPMSGLDAAARNAESGWFLLVSCDLLAFEPAWIDTLATARREGALAVAFRHTHWEPLIALYHTAIAAHTEIRINLSQLSLWRLLESVSAIGVPTPHDFPAKSQFNTPDDLHSLE